MKSYRLVLLVLIVALLPALAACDTVEPEASTSIAGTWVSRQTVTANDGSTVQADFILNLRGESSLTGSWDTKVNGNSLLGGDLSGSYTHPSVSVQLVVFGFEGDPMTGTVNEARTSITLRDSDGEVTTFTRH